MEKRRIYGLIGYPVKHSYSPSMHNAAFRKLRINGSYHLFPVEPQKFNRGFEEILKSGVSGLNVTLPYKEKVIKYLDKISAEAKMIGAVNTIVIKEGKLFGHNTDGKGFVKALKVMTDKNPKGRRIFMFGAGGAAKAVGFELSLAEVSSLAICDVLENKAKELATRINKYKKCGAKAVSFKNKKNIAEEILSADILINATPCGMKKTDPPLVDIELLRRGLVVCDLIYNPAHTRLIKDAKRKGLVAMNGIGMLLYQGVLSFKLWTGKHAPVDVMQRALQTRIAYSRS